MPLDFPNYPGIGDEFFGFVWDGTRWIARGTTVLPWLPLTGGQMSGPISLAGNAAMPLEAVPLQQVQSLVDAEGADLQPQIDAALHNVGRNLLHNGLFNIWQRGLGNWTTNLAYTADRWLINLGTGDTIMVQQAVATDAIRASIGNESCISLLSCTFTGSSTGGTTILQRIEDVHRLANRTVTVSFYANASLANMRVGVGMTQNFGAGGSASVVLPGQAVTLSATAAAFTRQSVTFNVPSIAGQTIGAGNFTVLGLWLSATPAQSVQTGGLGVQSGIINFWGVQLEVGTQATPLEKLDPQLDLANCQRFYQTSAFQIGGSNVSAGGFTPTSIPLGTHMRATPTVLIPSVNYSNASGLTIGGNTSASIISSTIAVTAAGGWLVSGNWTASADL